MERSLSPEEIAKKIVREISPVEFSEWEQNHLVPFIESELKAYGIQQRREAYRFVADDLEQFQCHCSVRVRALIPPQGKP